MIDVRCKFWDIAKRFERTHRCVRIVSTHGGFTLYQCSRKRGHGPDNLYCKQHAKLAERRKAES